MRQILLLLCVLNTAGALAQEYQEPDWIPPLPPPVEEYCGDQEQVTQPVISYRISAACALTDVRAVGEYKYGTEILRGEVMSLPEKEMIRRFESGNFVFYNEVRISLHKVLEQPATLVCTTDMMGKRLIDAHIEREKPIAEGRSVSIDESISLTDNQLPNLGIFTYTREVRHTTNNCPE